jgi:hypothetical protein
LYATIQEVMVRTSFEEVSALSDEKITSYIERAERWIRRATNRDFSEETDQDVLEDLKTATVLLVEYLWYWDNPDVKEDSINPVDSEKIGSYSFSGKKAKSGELTGMQELDNILTSLKNQPVSPLFLF